MVKEKCDQFVLLILVNFSAYIALDEIELFVFELKWNWKILPRFIWRQ